MGKMKKRISKWLLALLSTVMVLASLVGCGAADVNQALDVAIEVLEVMEELEAEVNAATEAESGAQTESAIELETKSQIESAIEPETESQIESAIIVDTEVQTEAEAEEKTEGPIETETAKETEDSDDDVLTIDEDGHYTSKEEVALYIHTYGKLPSNFISKKEAEELGWKKKDGAAGQLHVVAPGMSIGGSSFGNYEGLLPEKKGRKYYECDINYKKGNRGAERIVYSNDGLIFYTGDHYESFEQLYP